MAGIIAVLGKENINLEIKDSLLMMRHRGNIFSFIGSASTAKDIKELEKIEFNEKMQIASIAKQPQKRIAFDGEIYNWKELGMQNSSSPENYFLSLIQEKGLIDGCREFEKKANACYAIIFEHKGKVYGLTDPIGAKPLFYGKGFLNKVIASEPKAFKKMNINFPVPVGPGTLIELETGKSEKVYSYPKNLNTNIDELEKILKNAIELRMEDEKKIGILFSGGIDSSTVAFLASQLKKITLLSVGVEGSKDLDSSEKFSQATGIKLKQKVVDKDEIPFYAYKVMEALYFFDKMQLQIGVTEYVACSFAKENKFNIALTGQGSDELFCGYPAYIKTLEEKGYPGVRERCYQVMEEMQSRNLIRDDIIAANTGLNARNPMLDLEFVEKSLNLNPMEKIHSVNDSLRKWPVRKIAENNGLPEFVWKKEKKAMQYGSGIGKEVLKLFKQKKD